MSDDKTYNGWTNYETWGVALLLDNDEGTYTEAHDMAQQLKDAAPEHNNVPTIWTAEEAARFEMADWLKEYTETLCGIGADSEDLGIPEPSMMAQQLLGGALSDVNWDEIASHYITED